MLVWVKSLGLRLPSLELLNEIPRPDLPRQLENRTHIYHVWDKTASMPACSAEDLMSAQSLHQFPFTRAGLKGWRPKSAKTSNSRRCTAALWQKVDLKSLNTLELLLSHHF